uniref:GTPase HflX n=1 Tax=uncultured bacterium contig00078 TaxID=1181556 RepID=A0A806KL27_9BACT|nr:GTP-binding protein HflX [uncultured bacterium contig00078]
MPQKLYETVERKKRALLVSLAKEGDGGRELLGLAQTLELDVISHELINVRERQPKFGMGSGKAEELAGKAKEMEADILVFDWETTPTQQRNWEELTGIPVVDRQELIIQIFASRAATREAELQVQLAQLHYRLPRLTHKYIDLSRQRGGMYGTKGAGETKLETDRRQIENQIHKLEKQIEQVAKQRDLQRRQREKQGVPVCAIVGYTNAGKSSLLNALTGAAVLVEDKLFATLDATTRRFETAPGKTALLTDTVGFIRRLPHSLIKAFRSTLEEASHANLLLHVLDASDPDIDEYSKTTVQVLSELGAGEIPIITVLNKIDKIEQGQTDNLISRYPESTAVSVKSGAGLDNLKQEIVKRLF